MRHLDCIQRPRESRWHRAPSKMPSHVFEVPHPASGSLKQASNRRCRKTRSISLRYIRGFAIPVVLAITAILSAGMAAYLISMKASVDVSGASLQRRKAFYVADGVARGGIELVSEALRDMPPFPPVGEDLDEFLAQQQQELQDVLDAKREELQPARYEITRLEISGLTERNGLDLVPTGPFEGMLGDTRALTIAAEVRHEDLSHGAVASVRTSIVRSTVSMFQMFGFIDGYAYLVNGPGAKFAGRIHANGNLCAGAAGQLYAERLTTAGDFFLQGGPGCRAEHNGISSWRNLHVATLPLPAGLGTYATSGWESAFTPVIIDSSSPSWSSAMSTWHGQLQDQSFGVKPIRPAFTGVPLAQKGRTSAHNLVNNHDTSRFLVDPWVDGEPADVRAQKIAFQADLRILNGVWYLRNPSTPAELGTPIWSDRPGHAMADASETWEGSPVAVGQADIFGALARPERYSYYRTDATEPAKLLDAAFAPSTSLTHSRPVVSYGTLRRQVDSAGKPFWVPGYYPAKAQSPCHLDGGSSSRCWELLAATQAPHFLQGARAGFRDPWMETGLSPGAADCSTDRWNKMGADILPTNSYRNAVFQILPLNFDVAAFQAALLDTSPGELGSHFMGREFNGIVWIGATWPGSNDGYGDGTSADAATYWPYQGAQQQADADHALAGIPSGAPLSSLARYDGYAPPPNFPTPPGHARNTPPMQHATAAQLCSQDQAGQIATRFSIQASNGVITSDLSGAEVFRVPNCDSYFSISPTLLASMNAVRIFNARVLARSVLPKGLSVVTSLPMYVLGDLNTSSIPAEQPGDFQAGWVPLMVGGDTVSLLSNAWEDEEAPWNVPVRTYWPLRDASDTAYHAAFLFGWNESDIGCRDEFTYALRLQEHWSRGSGSPHERRIRGSIYIGFNSVYGTGFSNVHEANAGGSWHDGDFASKLYGFDYHLELPENQPPGSPVFVVTAVSRFLGR